MKVADVAREVLRLGMKSPDFVYRSNEPNGCMYVRESNGVLVGDCIVGQALVNLGCDVDVLRDADIALQLGRGGESASTMVNNFIQPESERDADLLAVLDSVQTMQDNQSPWGIAVKDLKEFFPELS